MNVDRRPVDDGLDIQSIEGRRLQIDGIRALTMFGVLFVHFWKNDPLTEDLRVSLFFVVSGFLITHILWSAKNRAGKINVLNFYARRALRLFPPLAVLVLVGVIFDMDGFREVWPWHLFQLSNFYFASTETVRPWVAGHLWSLNVIEQFYLIWPLVILFLPLRQIYVVTFVLMVMAMSLRSQGAYLGLGDWWPVFVFSFDPVFAGALTYLLAQNKDFAAIMSSRLALAVALLVITSPFYLWEEYSDSINYRLVSQPALCAIVLGAYVGYGGPVGWALQSRPAIFLSKISYGVYIYHLAVWWLFLEFSPKVMAPGAATFILMTTLSVIVATISWYALEEPLSRYKSKFPTRPAESGSAGGNAT